MLVYVINKHGKPLMPCKPSKARKLLKQNKAKVIRKEPYLVKGFRLFDKIEYNGETGFIFGRRSKGYFDIRTLDGKVLVKALVIRN